MHGSPSPHDQLSSEKAREGGDVGKGVEGWRGRMGVDTERGGVYKVHSLSPFYRARGRRNRRKNGCHWPETTESLGLMLRQKWAMVGMVTSIDLLTPLQITTRGGSWRLASSHTTSQTAASFPGLSGGSLGTRLHRQRKLMSFLLA